jgi:mitotic spindle assembly checkpoint protein MAD1
MLTSTSTKRGSLAAELERGTSLQLIFPQTQALSCRSLLDPRLSTAERQQQTKVFTSTLAHANLERQLWVAWTTKMELETKLRDWELQIERLERDRRLFADQASDERQEKERERAEHNEEKVRL